MSTRRGFLGRVAMWLGLASSYGMAAAFAARFLSPRKRAPSLRTVYVGRLEQIPEGDSRIAEDLRGTRLLLVREGEHVRAISTVCPHLGCRVRWERDKGRFFCPCHDGVFDREGRVLSGPPPRALESYDVQVAQGAVYVKMKEPV